MISPVQFRRLLGKEAEHLDEEEILQILDAQYRLARFAFGCRNFINIQSDLALSCGYCIVVSETKTTTNQTLSQNVSGTNRTTGALCSIRLMVANLKRVTSLLVYGQ